MESSKKTSEEVKEKKVSKVSNETEKVESSPSDKVNEIKNNVTGVLDKEVGGLTVKSIVIIVLAVLIVFLVIRGIVKSTNVDSKIPDYQVVYSNDDGDLMVVGKNGKNPIKLANDAYSNIEYAYTSNRYILFTKDDDLYLYDKNDGDETTKIAKEVKEFGFSKNDKYIYYINEDGELYSYKKDSKKLDNDVERIAGITDDLIFYEKEEDLYYKKLNGKGDKVKVASELKNCLVDEDGSKVLYQNEDNDLYIYKVSNKKATKIGTDIEDLLDFSSDFNTIIYQNNDNEVFEVNKTKSKKIISEVDDVLYSDAEEKQIVYELDEELFYQKSDKKAVKIGDSENVTRAVVKGNQLYYLEEDDDSYELYYAKIGSKISPKSIAEDVGSSIISSFGKGIVIFKDVEDSIGEMNVVKNGKLTKVADDVYVSSYTVSNDKNKLYFLGDYSSKNKSGSLMSTTGKKAKLIVDDVNSYDYIKNSLIYIQTGYSSKSGKSDLQVYNGKKVKKIVDGIKGTYGSTAKVTASYRK